MSATYRSWQNVRNMLEGEKNPWRTFEAFLKDFGERPEGTVFGRKDLRKPVSRRNCGWIEKGKLGERLQVKGCLRDKARKRGLSYTTVWKRVKKGWSEEDALKVPVRGYRKRAS